MQRDDTSCIDYFLIWKAQLDAERRHIAKLQSELSAYEAAANFNLDALENGLSGATNDNAVKTLNR